MTATLIPLTSAGPLSHQWFPVAPSAATEESPLAVRLLGNDLVLWRSSNGKVVAAPDRCTHSKRALSKGTVDDGRLSCPKHGWTFGDEGRCVFKPSGLPITDKAHLNSYPCMERYGLIWMSLDTPDSGFIDLPWDEDDNYRRVHSAVSVWRSNPVQIVETVLAETESESVEVGADLPFVVHSVAKGDGTSGYRRLLSCAPVDSRASLVATVVWVDGAADTDEATIVERVTGELTRIKSCTEELAAAGALPAADAVPGDQGSISSEWKRRLVELVQRR